MPSAPALAKEDPMFFFQNVFLFLLFFCAQLVWANPQATQTLMEDLNANQHVQGDFIQKIYDQRGNVLQQSQGTFSLSRPVQGSAAGKFRWETQSQEKAKPLQQLLLADGKKIWFYDASLQQVTVQKQQNIAMQNSPAMLLSGDLSQISQQYHITLHTDSGLQIPETTPSAPRLVGMEILDNLGQKTRIDFSNPHPQVTSDAFQFTPPRGVTVVQG